MSTLADYIGRTVDVSAFHGVEATGEVQLRQVLAETESSGLVITGIQKLAQRFVLEFLTDKGSMKYLPARGGTFLANARAGSLRTEVDVFTSFELALGSIESALLAEENSTDPDDERYLFAELTNIVFTPDHIKLYITLNSRAKTTRSIILPISTLT
jgi:hypothetical protein